MVSFRHVLVPLEPDLSHVAVAHGTALARACGARLSGLETEAFEPVADFLNRHDVDLVVVGRPSHAGLGRLFRESLGDRLCGTAACSVLSVDRLPKDEARPVTRVLCALDLDQTSEATLDLAARVAVDLRAGLSLLHVVDAWEWPSPEPQSRDGVAAMRSRLAWAAYERLATLVCAHDPELEVDTQVTFGVAPLEILRAIGSVGADLLVLGAHVRRLLGHTLLGATTQYLLREAPCPVLLARAAPAPAVKAVTTPASSAHVPHV